MIQFLIKNKEEVIDIGKVLSVAISSSLIGIYNNIINVAILNVILNKLSVYDIVIEGTVKFGTALSVVLGCIYVGIKIIILIRDKLIKKWHK